MRELPKIVQLRNFLAFIRYGSIRTASQALFQTQPGITRSIQELERILGVTLIARGPHGMVLTEMGRLFEPKANMILNDLERAVEELDQKNELSLGSVIFGCSHLPAFSILPAIINEFQQENPSLRMTIIEGQLAELITSLRRGRLDFFIGMESPEISLSDFFVDFSIKAEFCIIVRKEHPLLNCHSLSQLQGAKWYFPNVRTGYYKELESFIFPNGKEPNDIIIYGDSMNIGEELVLSEDYLFVGPKAMLEISYIKDAITMLPIQEELPDALYMMIYRQQQSVNPLIRKLMDKIRAACGEFIEKIKFKKLLAAYIKMQMEAGRL